MARRRIESALSPRAVLPASDNYPRGKGLGKDYQPEAEREDADEDDEDDVEETPEAKAKRHDTILKRARERWQLALDADKDQRERELEDLKFARGLPEDQWPEEILAARRGGKGADGSKGSAARPTLTIPKLKQSVTQVQNELKNARYSVLVKCKDADADESVAETIQGLYRVIEVDSNAQYARSWAGGRAIVCGRGWYRVGTEYAHDGDFDLDIQIEAIHNQGAVYIDPASVKPDASDMEYAFVIEDIPLAEFKRRWGKSKAARRKGDGSGADVLGLESQTDAPPDWIDATYTRVAEYWEIEHEDRALWYSPILPAELGNRIVVDDDGGLYTTEGEEVPAEIAALIDLKVAKRHPDARDRTVDVRTVKRYVITGCDVLEEAEWEGRWIPLVPVYGEKHVIDGKSTTYLGMVAPSKDAQRSYNYAVSTEMESLGLTNKAPYILDPKQIEGFEGVWANANVTNPAWLPSRQYDDEGRPYTPPQRNVVEPALAGVVAVIQQADQDIKATTGRFDPSLGAISSNERSGKAIQALQQQGEQSSSHFLMNLAQISMPHEARIVLDLIPKVYDRPGRILRTLGKDDQQEQMVMVAGPNGQPMPMPAQPQGKPVPSAVDLSRGQYAVTVSVGKSAASQKDANLDLLMALAESTKGASVPFTADIIAKQMDGPIGDEMAERMELMNPAIAQAKAAKQQGIPPEAQSAVLAMQQQMQQMQQQLQEAQQIIQTEQHKAQAQAQLEMQKAQIAADLKGRDVEIEAQKAQLKAQADAEANAAKIAAEMERVRLENEYKLRLQNDQQAHELALAELEHKWKAQIELEKAKLSMAAQREQAQIQATTQRDADVRQFSMSHAQRMTDAAMSDAEARRDQAFQREATESERSFAAEQADADRAAAERAARNKIANSQRKPEQS